MYGTIKEKCRIVPMQLVGIIRSQKKMSVEPSKIQVKDVSIMGPRRPPAVFIHGTGIVEIKQS
jgi:hypothetical protein